VTPTSAAGATLTAMSAGRVVIFALALILPLTACLMFAAGDIGPHPWGKQTHSAAHAAVKLPSGIATTPTALFALPLVGRLAAQGAAPPSSIALQPPFIPPRV
jgi:hypothetical protein